MAATFSWVQYVGAGTSSSLANTSSNNAMSWDFESADSSGTTSYTANPVSAGSNSYPVWLKGYFTNANPFTVSNFKFWQFNPAASSANTASFTIVGTAQTTYSQATNTTTAVGWASNVAVPTSTSSTGSPAGPLSLGTANFGTTAGNSGVVTGGSAWIALQLSAGAAAPAGTTGYFGFTLQYDEQ